MAAVPIASQTRIKKKKDKFVPELNFLSTTPCRRMGEWM
jgi:hypothetical protein